MRFVSILIISSFIFSTAFAKDPHQRRTIARFVTNGCSTPFKIAAGTYEECCIRHDLAYWMGGSLENKKAADVALVNCMMSKGATTWTGAMWEAALARFGLAQWGNRWTPPRENTPLTEEELEEVNLKIGDQRSEIPIVRSYQNHAMCTQRVLDRVPIVTILERPNGLTCYNLVSTSNNSNSYAQVVYSDECNGHFIHQFDFKPPDKVLNEQLAAYGDCSQKIRKESWTDQKLPNTFRTSPVLIKGSQ